MGDVTKYVGILIGITFASIIMTLQPSIFTGILNRTYSTVTDIPLPDIWVMDPKVQFIDDIKPMQDTQLYRVRSIDGVDWAVPLFKSSIRARLHNGVFQTCNLIGIDDASLIGGPTQMVEGKLTNLRKSPGIIVDSDSAKGKLAQVLPNGEIIPVKIGDIMELNDNEAEVVAISKATPTLQSVPVLYTTYSRATSFVPQERQLLSFVLVKIKKGEKLQTVKERIERYTGLAAYTRSEFKNLTLKYYAEKTGLVINFGMTVILGFLVGAVIAGQMFFNFTYENLKYFATLKALGATNKLILKMILIQAFSTGLIGWGLGLGFTAVIGVNYLHASLLSFNMTWIVLFGSLLGMMIIVSVAAFLSIIKVMRLEPAIVFQS